MSRLFHSLAGRLTLWYAGVFSLCFLTVFGAFFLIMRIHFQNWTDEDLRGEVLEVRMAYEERGLEGVARQLKLEAASEGARFMGRIIDAEGRVAFQATPGHWEHVPIDGNLVDIARSGRESIELLELDDRHAARVIYSRLSESHIVQIGLDLAEHENWMRKFSGELFKVALLALVLSVSAGGFMARRALAPVREVARTASAISGRSMGQRVPVSRHGDEVTQLAESFNGMLDRIDTLVEGLREVTDTLAHDLRTPIAGIRGVAEVTLRVRRDPGAYQEALYQIIEQLDRLLTRFNSILDVAEAESGALALRFDTVRMDSLVNETVQVFEPVAADRGIHLEATIQADVAVTGDAGRLSQVVANLLDNALKYTPPGGHIRLTVEENTHPRGVVVTVSDTGAGIPEKDLPHIFERYYRGDKSRSGTGIGLGLPLVQGIVQAHGGSVSVESKPEEGATFRVFLPYDSKPAVENGTS